MAEKTYVLLDIEWVTKQNRQIGPTQLAALRVDSRWNGNELFYTRVRPHDASFKLWKHIAFSGGRPEDFLCAGNLYSAFDRLKAWIKENDVLCVWHKDSKSTICTMHSVLYQEAFPWDIVVLNEYTNHYSQQFGIEKNDLKIIADAVNGKVYQPVHESANDVRTLQSVLKGLCFPAAVLTEMEPQELKQNMPAPDDPELEPVCYFDRDFCVVHSPECRYLDDSLIPIYKPGTDFFFRTNYHYCTCTKHLQRKARMVRNADIISRSQYNFVYAKDSDVFHRRDCGLVLSAKADIWGSVHYKKCANKGLRPCRACRPNLEKSKDTGDTYKKILFQGGSFTTVKSWDTGEGVGQRTLSKEEKRSYARFQEAQKERYSRTGDAFATKTEKDDFYTLTKSSYGFFAAEGYSSFHLRHCSKLKGLSNVRGFSTCRDAKKQGYKPCRCCKPTAKHDITCSVPITSKERSNETVDVLVMGCRQNGYQYRKYTTEFYMETPVGKWIIQTEVKPYIVKHINLVKTPFNEFQYHRQPRLFLSLEDTFQYIQKHDSELMAKQPDHYWQTTAQNENRASG